MATFQKRGSSWRAIIRRKGERVSKSFTTKAEAIAWAAAQEADIVAGKNGAIPNKTFGDLLDRYAETVSPTKRGERWEQIRIALFKTLPFAAVHLRELNASHFAAWRDQRMKEVSAGSVRREWNLLSNACTVAVKEWKWLGHHPLKEIKKPKAPPPRDVILSDDVIERMLHSFGYFHDEAPTTATARTGAIMLFAIETGMRLKEMTRLTWPMVDIEDRICHVSHDSKTGKRQVPLSSEAIRILKQLEGIKAEKDNRVFQVTENTVDALFRRTREKAMLGGFTFHDTKHTACTRLAKKLTVFELARMVGTRDLKTLMIYYNESASNIAKKLD
ncbi:tyrosine-type recombinase/integrase [Methylobacillus pratensis]